MDSMIPTKQPKSMAPLPVASPGAGAAIVVVVHLELHPPMPRHKKQDETLVVAVRPRRQKCIPTKNKTNFSVPATLLI